MIEDVSKFGIKTSEEERLERLAICHSCDELKNDICNQCACPLDYVTTSKYKKCPLGKWEV